MTARLFPDTPAFQLAGDAGKGRLLSALGQPQWRYYRTAQTKPAALHYHLNKGHAYVDGNKRLALAAMLGFLYINDFYCVASDTELAVFALGVANDSFTLEESARFVQVRAFRWTWSYERFARWVASHTPSDAVAILALLQDQQGPALRLPAAIKAQLDAVYGTDA